MNEQLAVRARDKVAKATGLTSVKANIVLRDARNNAGREIVVMCADSGIQASCTKILPAMMDGIPVKVELRPAPGSSQGLRLNMNHGRVVLRDQ